MQHDWMLDVLSDLKTFAANHNMDRLEEQLNDTIMIAAGDMLATKKQVRILGADGRQDKRFPRTIGASTNA